MRDDEPKILNLSFLKLAFLRFEVELILVEMVQNYVGDSAMLL